MLPGILRPPFEHWSYGAIAFPTCAAFLAAVSDEDLGALETAVESEVARSNVERIAGELHAMGYVFRAKELVPPRVSRAATIRKIEKALGMHDVFAAGGFPGLRGTNGPLRAVVDRLAALCATV